MEVAIDTFQTVSREHARPAAVQAHAAASLKAFGGVSRWAAAADRAGVPARPAMLVGMWGKKTRLSA